MTQASTVRAAVARRKTLPADAGLDQLMADPRLGSTAKAIAVALVRNWAWYKDHCWPSDRSIGLKVGRSPGHVQRCMRQLEAAGYVARERTDEVPTGRRLWLVWRDSLSCHRNAVTSAPVMGARGDAAPAREAPTAPARDEQGECEKENRTRPESAAGPGSPPPPAGVVREEPPLAELYQWAEGRDPILARIGRRRLEDLGIIRGFAAAVRTDGPRMVAAAPAPRPGPG